MLRGTTTISRPDLYERVWSQPVRTVAKVYGISDVALAKICKKLDVPRPPRGFWARRKAGVKAAVPPLPPLRKGIPDRYVGRSAPVMDIDSDLGDEARELLARERNPEMAIVVPSEIGSRHPTVRKYAGVLRGAGKQLHKIRREQACLDVCARGVALRRGLRVMDTLLKALDRRGFEVTVSEPVTSRTVGYHRPGTDITPSKTTVQILGFDVEFGIEESVDIVKVQPAPVSRGGPSAADSWSWTPPPEYQRRPNGSLELVIRSSCRHGSRKTWADGKKQKIEQCLNAFIIALIRTAEHMRVAKLEAERLERERHEAEIRRWEEAERRRIEEARVQDLDHRINLSRKAEAIRAFASQFEAVAQARGQDVSPDGEVGRWLSWVRGRAQRMERKALEMNGAE